MMRLLNFVLKGYFLNRGYESICCFIIRFSSFKVS